ncbi:MAG TPA: hypothetical protein VGC45_05595 [Gryllotalpicola sp.]
MSGLALIWRFARRSALLTRGQAVLIAVLIALPIAGFSGAMLVLQSSDPTPQEQLTGLLGRTQSKLLPVSVPDPTLHQAPAGSLDWDVARDGHGNPSAESAQASYVAPQTVLPAGTRVLRLADSIAEVGTATGVADLPVTLGPSWDRSFVGRFRIVQGRAPTEAHEIMVSEPTLTRLGVHLGGTVHLRMPVAGDYTVTGVLEDSRGPRSVQELFLPDRAFDGTAAEPAPTAYSYYLPTLDLNATELRAVNHAGFVATSRWIVARHGVRDWGEMSRQGPTLYFLIGLAALFGVFEVVLLAGSAFFIGARARQRVLAIVASTGASRSMLVGIVTITGAGLGLIGGLVGVAAGIGAGSLWLSLTADGSVQRYPGYHLYWSTHILIVLFAGVVGYAAALVPALSVSRLDIVAALRGATRPLRVRRRRPVVGMAMIVVGVAITVGAGILLAGVSSGWFAGPPGDPSWIQQHEARLSELLGYPLTGGVIITQLGLIVAAGLVLRTASFLLGRLGIATTLASRDLDRNRSRAVPAIASVMITSFLAVLAMGFLSSNSAANDAQYMWVTNDDQALAYVSGGSPASLRLQQRQIDQFESTLSRTLPVHGGYTVISGAPFPSWAEDPAKDDTLYPAPVPPKAQLCPLRDESGNIAYDQISRDWRCSDGWANVAESADGVPTIVVGDVGVLTAILGHAPSAAAAAALETGGAVSLHRSFVRDGQLTIGWYTAVDRQQGLMKAKKLESPQRVDTVPATLETTPQPLGFGAVLSPAAAERLGIRATAQSVLTQLRRDPTSAESDALQAGMDVINAQDPAGTANGGPGDFGSRVETGPDESTGPWLWGALAASSLIAIASAVVALTLARQDGARDDGVFAVVGASPFMRRRLAFWQAVVLVGSGALLGTATATLAVFASDGIGPGKVFAMPWPQVVLGTVGLTLVVALGAWVAAGRLRPTEVGRQAIT